MQETVPSHLNFLRILNKHTRNRVAQVNKRFTAKLLITKYTVKIYTNITFSSIHLFKWTAEIEQEALYLTTSFVKFTSPH